MLQITLADELETLKLGERCAGLLAHLPESKLVIGLSGDLGTGKTTFTRGLAKSLGVLEPVCSPTFTMLNEYSSGLVPLYHFDLYRLSEDAAAGRLAELAAELAELLSEAGVVVVEWIDLCPELLADVEDLRIVFSHSQDGSRLAALEPLNRLGRLHCIGDILAS